MFLNGVLLAQATYAGTLLATTTSVRIGMLPTGGDNYWFNGYMDEIRFTKGVARYTAPFDMPTEAFANEGTLVTETLVRTDSNGGDSTATLDAIRQVKNLILA